MQTVRLALNAMATRFELVIHGDDPILMRAAGEEALSEIKRLGERLSFYNPSSEISHLNGREPWCPIRITPELFSLLKKSSELYVQTNGAFDITVGTLMNCWGFVRGTGTWPLESRRVAALEKTGMDQVILNEEESTVTFKKDHMEIDLGAIGKGYALEEAEDILRTCGIKSALIHGGTSTITAIGPPSSKEDGWVIGVADPQDESKVLTSITICDESFSVSAPHGKAFYKGNKVWGHVIDPRVGFPVQGASVAVVIHSSATICDAVSTAILAMNPDEVEQMAQKFQNMRILCGYSDGDGLKLVSHGFDSVNSTIFQ